MGVPTAAGELVKKYPLIPSGDNASCPPSKSGIHPDLKVGIATGFFVNGTRKLMLHDWRALVPEEG
jgi:hypothetical protein